MIYELPRFRTGLFQCPLKRSQAFCILIDKLQDNDVLVSDFNEL